MKEYKVIEIQDVINVSADTTPKEYEKPINMFAKAGWRLVAVDNDRMYFEKEIHNGSKN